MSSDNRWRFYAGKVRQRYPEFRRCPRCDLRGDPKQEMTSDWVEAELDDNQRWIVAHRIAMQHGRPVIAETRVFPNEPGRRQPGEWSGDTSEENPSVPEGGLTARLLRDVTTESALQALRPLPNSLSDRLTSIRSAEAIPAAITAATLSSRGYETLDSGKPIGRPRLSQLYLARLAQRYVQAVDEGDRKPNQTLKHWLAQQNAHVSESGVRDQLNKAVREGLLDRPNTTGKAGGQLTDLARAILAADDPSVDISDIKYDSGGRR